MSCWQLKKWYPVICFFYLFFFVLLCFSFFSYTETSHHVVILYMWQSRNVKATKQHTRIDVHPATRFFALNKECGTFIIPYSLFRENFWGFFKTLFLPPWRHVRHISVWSSIWLEVIMFFERSRFFRDNDMSALVLILRKEQYCMFVLYIRMFVGDRLNIIVTSVNTYPPKAVIWYYCIVDHGYQKYLSGLHVIKRSQSCLLLLLLLFFLPAFLC